MNKKKSFTANEKENIYATTTKRMQLKCSTHIEKYMHTVTQIDINHMKQGFSRTQMQNVNEMSLKFNVMHFIFKVFSIHIFYMWWGEKIETKMWDLNDDEEQ